MVLQRFRQEVRLARRITHPNVCRVYDLSRGEIQDREGHSGELLFLTMEFLEGETLAARLRRAGKLAQGEVLSIARQLASGLDAAHALGVIHRDIKPGNICMVTGSENASAPERIVITDFGLARLDPIHAGAEALSSIGTSHGVGTFGYMAPEQLLGHNVSAGTDIYAFGLVLFEMLTGARPSSPQAVRDELGFHLSGGLSSPGITPLLPPPHWEEAIAGCLRLVPEERFQSAAAVIRALDEGESLLPAASLAASQPAPEKARSLRWLPRRPLFRALVATAVVACFAAGLRFYGWQQSSDTAPGALVYLAPVENRTGERPLDDVTELIEAALQQSTNVNVLGAQSVGDILQNMAKPPEAARDRSTAREIAMRAGAVRVLFPVLSHSGNVYRLDVDVQQPDNTPAVFRRHWLNHFVWNASTQSATSSSAVPPELLGAMRDATDWIRKIVGESSADIARLDVPPGDVTTGNWRALQDYAEGRRLLTQGRKEAAVDMFRSATTWDPHFALAYAELADNLMSLFRTEESLAAYNKALGLEQEGRLTSRERFFIVGTHSSDTEDFQVAADAFKSYTDLYPNDYLGWFYLAYPLTELGRPRDAILALKRSLDLHPRGAGTKAKLALTHLIAGEPTESRALSQRLAQEGYSDEAFYTSGVEAFVEGNLPAAESDFSKLQASAQSQTFKAFGYSHLARVLAEQGLWSRSLGVLDQGIEESRQADDQGNVTAQLLDKAWVLCHLGRDREAFETLDLITSEELDPFHVTTYSEVLGNAAFDPSPAVRLESMRRMHALLAHVRGKPSDRSMMMAQHRLQSELAGASGDWARALAEAAAASKLDAVITDRTYLGWALKHAAEHEHDAAHALLLRNQAVQAYRLTVDHPANSWYEAWLYPPGFVAEERHSLHRLCPGAPAADEAHPSSPLRVPLPLAACGASTPTGVPDLHAAIN